MATLPTAYGERMSLRLLPLATTCRTLSQLGLRAKQEQQLQHWLQQSGGLLIVTGPTGTGKTTTLYAMLQQLGDSTRNLLTLEDPIEQLLMNVQQVQVHPQIGLTFAAGLRALLRHDPDVMMIGEIRDQETADIAVRVALTGHLVLSSMHTVDAVGAITRLLDMGVAPYRVAAALRGVIAQRLLRRSCSRCRGRRCAQCQHTGEQGRFGVFEILPITQEIQHQILRGASFPALRQTMYRLGIPTLATAIQACVDEGTVTTREATRAVNSLGATFC